MAGFLDRVANEAGPRADQAIDNAKGQALGLTGQSGLSEMWVGDLCSAFMSLHEPSQCPACAAQQLGS